MRRFVPGRTSITEFEVLLAASKERLELLDGEVVAFADGSVAHGMLVSRLHKAVANATYGRCQAFTSDVAVRIEGRETYVFPDVSLTCERLDAGATAIVAPDLIIEVMSEESNGRDRGEKLDAYRCLPTLAEYLLVDSRRVWLSLFRRLAENVRTLSTYRLGQSVQLCTIDVTIDVAELYAGTARVLTA